MPQPIGPDPAVQDQRPMDADQLLKTIAAVRSRARAMLLVQRLAFMLGWLLLGGVLIGLLDYLVRFPGPIRTVLLGGLVIGLGAGLLRWILPAVRFAPSLTEIALRLERRHPEVRGLLASAVDFAREPAGAPPPPGMGGAMAARAVDQAVAKASRSLGGDAVSGSRAVEGGVWLAAGLAVALAPMIIAPTMWSIAAQRVLTPWSGAAWPKRWDVADATEVRVHALGEALALRAVVAKAPVGPEQADVSVTYRAFGPTGRPLGPARTELLTWQERRAETGGKQLGELFERLIEPTGDTLRYRFGSGDDQTAWREVRLVEPPTIVRASATIEPPAYLAGPGAEPPPAVDLGPGDDERAAAPSSISGSTVRLTLGLNKPASSRPPLDQVLEAAGAAPGSVRIWTAGDDGSTIGASFVLDGPLRLPITLVDEFEVASRTESVYRFDAIDDAPPSASITEPPRDTTVLASAVVDVAAEGRDDVGLERTALEQRVFTPAGGGGNAPSGPGGAMAPRGAAGIIAEAVAAGALEATASASVEIASLDVEPGDRIELHALAFDVYRDAAGAARPPTRSAVRVLRVISPTDFVDELWRELADVREQAIRAEGEQEDVERMVGERGVDGRTQRAQAQVSQRVARQAERLEQVRERIAENRLGDPALEVRLAEAADAAQQAGRASAEASTQLDRAAAEQRDAAESSPPDGEDEDRPQAGAELTPERREAVARAQDQAEAELERLVRVLDTGQDAWAVRNQIERTLEEQRQLREATERLGLETVGRSVDQLTPEERSELGDIVSRQEELAGELQELTDDMREREASLAENDPAAAAAVRDARMTAEQSGAQQNMEEAAENASENRMTQAAEQQQAAEEALEQMLDALDESEEQRAEVLRRLLQTVLQSIQVLIEDQEAALTALDRARDAGVFDGLDRDMIDLHQATLGVSDLVNTSGPELAGVASLLGKAAGAQVLAIQALRGSPVDDDAAQTQEARSLDLLKQALAAAEQLDQRLEEQERERKRRELRQAYAGLLAREIAIRDATEVFTRAERLSRRDRAQVRTLAEQQTAIQDDLAALLAETEELAEASVFEYAHERLDRLAATAADRLDRADPKAALPPEDGVVALLQGVLQSLEDPEQDRPFDDRAGGGGQGGGGQPGGEEAPLIPPVAQLRLLRALQADLAERTVAVGDGGGDTAQIGSEQGDLHRLGAEIVEEMQRQGPGGPPQPVLPGVPDVPEPPDDPGEPGPAGPEAGAWPAATETPERDGRTVE